MAGVAFFFPPEGITILGKQISFPNLRSYFSTNQNQKTNIDNIVALADAEDKLNDADTTKASLKQDTAAKKEITYRSKRPCH